MHVSNVRLIFMINKKWVAQKSNLDSKIPVFNVWFIHLLISILGKQSFWTRWKVLHSKANNAARFIEHVFVFFFFIDAETH